MRQACRESWYNVLMQETTQRIIKLLGLLLPDLLIKKCSNKRHSKSRYFSCSKYWPWRRLALLVEILTNKFCSYAALPALQSVWNRGSFQYIKTNIQSKIQLPWFLAGASHRGNCAFIPTYVVSDEICVIMFNTCNKINENKLMFRVLRTVF